MAGYAHDYSKSNNALDAEANGLYPASVVARELSVPVDAVRAAGAVEWHHTSKMYNETEYYDLDGVREFLATDEGLAALAAAKAARKTGAIVYENCKVEWIEWSGSLRRPVATERRAENCTVSHKGKTYTITLPGGERIVKRAGTNGLSIHMPGRFLQ